MSASSVPWDTYCPVCTEVTLPAVLMKIVVGSPSITASDRRLVVVV
jgi:hypothetical protein